MKSDRQKTITQQTVGQEAIELRTIVEKRASAPDSHSYQDETCVILLLLRGSSNRVVLGGIRIAIRIVGFLVANSHAEQTPHNGGHREAARACDS